MPVIDCSRVIYYAASEIEKNYGFFAGKVRQDMARDKKRTKQNKLFKENEYMKIGNTWLISDKAIKRVYGMPKTQQPLNEADKNK